MSLFFIYKDLIYLVHATASVFKEGYAHENYATQDSSGMCHLMPQCHLPEWQEDRGAGLCTPWQLDAK